VEAQLTFNTWIANGMTVQGMADGAISSLDRALSLVSKEPDAGFPVQLYIAKIRALVAVGGVGRAASAAEAQRLIDSSLKYARENDILGAQCELLNQAGLLALREHENEAPHVAFQSMIISHQPRNLRVELANVAQKEICMAHPLETTIRDAYAAFGRGDVDGYLQPCTQDFSFNIPGRGAIAGSWRGKEGLYELAHMAMEVTGGSFREEVEDVLANDYHAVVLARHQFTREGQPREYRTAHVYEIHDGQLAQCWEQPQDLSAFDEAWGVVQARSAKL
jgi:uncharacterized protein